MRKFLTILLVAGAVWLGLRFYDYARTRVHEGDRREDLRGDRPAPGKLPGMPAHLEAGLDEARRQGAAGLASWLTRHRFQVRDPRLAEIELDYVVLVGPRDRAEARRVLEAVGGRLTPDSPMFERHRQLQRAYE